MTPSCDYCGKPARLVRGTELHPHRPDLRSQFFWLCRPCGAWVGCHGESGNPLGRLANAELRKWKQKVHSVLDPIWKKGIMSRSATYAWLAGGLGITKDECHVGMFDVMRCQHALLFIQASAPSLPPPPAKSPGFWKQGKWRYRR